MTQSSPTHREIRAAGRAGQLAAARRWFARTAGIRGGIRNAHRRHWARAAVLVAIAVTIVSLTEDGNLAEFGQMVLLAAAAAEVAIGHQLRERELDEPLLERLIEREEKIVRAELGLDPIDPS